MTTRYKFSVLKSFVLRDGQTVFVGTVDPELPLIPPGKCRIVASDGQVLTELNIDGETIVEQNGHPSYRVISTRDNLSLGEGGLDNGYFTIQPMTK